MQRVRRWDAHGAVAAAALCPRTWECTAAATCGQPARAHGHERPPPCPLLPLPTPAHLGAYTGGKAAWRRVLSAFWGPFQAAVGSMAAIRTTQVYDMLDAALDAYLFPKPPALLTAPSSSAAPTTAPTTTTTIDVTPSRVVSVRGSSARSAAASSSGMAAPPDAAGAPGAAAGPAPQRDPRRCPKCGVGRLVLKPSRYGGFIGCSNFADEALQCDFARPLLPVAAAEGALVVCLACVALCAAAAAGWDAGLPVIGSRGC